MNMKCRSGDIALVIHDEPGCIANVGHLLEVRGPAKIDPRKDMHCWQIQPLHQQLWKVAETDGSITTEFVTWESRVTHPDQWLLPLRPQSQASPWEMQEELDEWLLSDYCVEDLNHVAHERAMKKIYGTPNELPETVVFTREDN